MPCCSLNLFPDVSGAARLAPSGFGLCEVRKLTKASRPENVSCTKFPPFEFELMLSFNRFLEEHSVGRSSAGKVKQFCWLFSTFSNLPS